MVASLITTPREVILNVFFYLDEWGDLASLALTCRSMYPIADNELHRRASKIQYFLCWACEFGKIDMVRRLLNAGADAAKRWENEEFKWQSSIGHPRAVKSESTLLSPLNMLDWFYGHHPTRQASSSHSHDGYQSLTSYLRSRRRTFGSNGHPNFQIVRFGNHPQLETSRPGGSSVEVNGFRVPHLPTHSDYIGTTSNIEPNFGLVLPKYYVDDFLFGSGDYCEGGPCQWSPLHLAAMNGHLEIAELLLKHGADLNGTAEKMCRCVHPTLSEREEHDGDEAVRCGFWNARASYNEADEDPFCQYVTATPLHIALCYRQQEVAIMLLQRGAAPFFDNPRWGVHITHTAAAHGCLDVLKFLLGANCDLNIQDSRGLTPLYYAYWNRQRETLRWLLKNGALVDVELGAGLTLLHIACLDGISDIAYLLIDAGADVNRLWGERICPYLGQLGPLEICCALQLPLDQVDNKHRVDPKFEQRKLELMKKLLDAGARVRRITSNRVESNERLAFPQFSAVTMAAAHNSLPMLQLLLDSGAVDFSQEGSAIHEALYPSFTKCVNLYIRNPLPTLRWLVEHNVPVERGTILTLDAVSYVCGLGTEVKWKGEVLEWLINSNICDNTPHTILKLAARPDISRRVHPMDYHLGYQDYWETTAFLEALQAFDFPTCERLLLYDPRPDFGNIFRTFINIAKQIDRAKERRFLSKISVQSPSWVFHGGDYNHKQKIRRFGEQLKFLVKVDENKSISQMPGCFVQLLNAPDITPPSLLLDAGLPNEVDIVSGGLEVNADRRQIQQVIDLSEILHRKGFLADGGKGWDLAIRLAIAILCLDWNAAHFFLEQGAETAWAFGVGMEHFCEALSALRLAPAPETIGHHLFKALLSRWNNRQAWSRTDVPTTMLFEACTGPLDLAHFLTNDSIDINAIDAKGCTALHNLTAYMKSARPRESLRLLQLLRAGADPRIEDRNGQCLMDVFRNMHEDHPHYNSIIYNLEVVRLEEDEESDDVEFDLRFPRSQEEGDVETELHWEVETFVFDGPVLEPSYE